MQSSRRPACESVETRLLLKACSAVAAELECWLIREVDDFDRLTPGQSLVLEAWSALTLAGECGVEGGCGDVVAAAAVVLDEFDSETAGVAPIRDMAAAPVVVEARRGVTPPSCVVPATGWSSPSSLPSRGWATHQGGAL